MLRGMWAMIGELLLAVCAPLYGCAAAPVAAGHVRSFDTQVIVREDGTLLIRESITIVTAHEGVEEALWRGFAADYMDQAGERHPFVFEPLEVLRDGQEIPYSVREVLGGKEVAFGEKAVSAVAGEHTYTLAFRTGPMVETWAGRASVRWMVQWACPVQEACATISVPPAVPRDQLSLRGQVASRGRAVREVAGALDNSGHAVFKAEDGLGTDEGLLAVVSWPAAQGASAPAGSAPPPG
jgi:hypothetical protein